MRVGVQALQVLAKRGTVPRLFAIGKAARVIDE